MSIPVLAQVYDEVRRLSIAGSVVASGDFRLKKLVPVLEQTGKKAPVFAKVAEAVTKLIDSTEKTSGEALLELSTLINAILYTQGETGVSGELTAIETRDVGKQTTPASARMLKPLLEALTTKGSGRSEVIEEAFERGMFGDLRLVAPALRALDDSYSEIADFIAEKVIPLYGKSVWPELRAPFDHKGRGGHVRRLLLMHQFDPAATRELVELALDEGSKEVRVAAIECLGSAKTDLPILLEQAKAKAKEVRKAAITALARVDDSQATQALRTAFQGNDIEHMIAPIQSTPNTEIVSFVLEATRAELNTLLAGKEKDKSKVSRLVARFLQVLECLRYRNDKPTEAFLLSLLAERDTFASIKSDPGGKDIDAQLIAMLADGSPNMQRAIVALHPKLPADLLDIAFVAAWRVCKPAEVFDSFSPYVTAKVDPKKKGNDSPYQKQKVIIDALVDGERRFYNGAWVAACDAQGRPLSEILDPRWLDLAVQQKNIDMIESLAVANHRASNKFLSESFGERLKGKSSDAHAMHSILQTMVRVKHPDATDALIAIVEKYDKASRWSELYQAAPLISRLPREALSRLESLFPKLNERTIDVLLPYVEVLKDRIKQEAE